MKKIFLLYLYLSFTFFLSAQDIGSSNAIQLVTKNIAAIGLGNEDIANMVVKDAYYNEISGTQLVYLQQTFKGLPVFNQIHVLAFKNSILVSESGGRISSIEKRSKWASAQPTMSSSNAVITAIGSKKINISEPLTPSETNPGKKYDFGKLGIARENVTAELLWVSLQNGKEVRLAWQVYFVPKNTPDHWMIRVDANTNQVIDENNLTVYCNWDEHHNHNADGITETKSISAGTQSINPFTFGPLLVGTVNYLVIPFPAESPIHTGGTPAIRTNPWTMAPGNATSLGWHNDGTTDYIISRGNNVYAYADRMNNSTGIPATSTTSPDPLNFNFPPDFTVAPTTPAFQQFSITNLFYWNNILHDLSYQYGFTEPAGNFQASNLGRGGFGNDYVLAEAQDGGSTNNANFATPPDGGSPTMQMYLWTAQNPDRDGDLDNGIVIHEGSHGISNRLTGGPSTTSCLSNNEQMGEGWSDYIALMTTQNWTTSTINDGFNSPRGLGLYAYGPSLRPAPYTTNMAINNFTYSNLPTLAAPHGVGFLWCTILWDMTWNIIQIDGINTNIFNSAGVGGNTVALKLVLEGMKLQPCNPGFVDARNAILEADQILFAGRYRCAIYEAFSRRGLGLLASQGSANDITDGVADFSGGFTLTLTQNVAQAPEGSNITYTNTVTTCSPISNYLLTDTLPLNVTWVSGGTYNAASRVVSFPVNLAMGTSQTYSFTVKINPGSYTPTLILINDQVTGPAGTIPPFWTATSTTSNVWTVHNARSKSAPNSYFSPDPDIISDQFLTTTNNLSMGATPTPLVFWHWYNTEENYDGAVLEVSKNSGLTWSDMGPFITQGGYNGSIDGGFQNPLANRPAWTGNSSAFIRTSVRMSSFANQDIKIRFRLGSDSLIADVGWNVDDISLKNEPVVDIRSNIFNASNIRITFKDTVTIILSSAACLPVFLSSQPENLNGCTGSSASFNVITQGASPTYQWYVSTNGGITYTLLPGETFSTLNLTAITTAMNNNLYRVVVSNTCPSTITSNAVELSVNSMAEINTQPADVSICPGSNTSFSVAAAGTGLSYQWQVSTNGGSTFTDIAGATSSSININDVTSVMNNNLYRVVIMNICSPTGIISNVAKLTVLQPVIIEIQPADVTGCINGNSTFSVVATGSNLTYQWQVSVDGNPFTDLTDTPPYSGVNTNTLNISEHTTVFNGYRYRVLVSGTPCGTVTSSTSTLTINALPTVLINASPFSSLYPGLRSILFATVNPPGMYTYNWYKNGVLEPDSIRNSYTLDVDAYGVYAVTATDENGCTSALSNLVTTLDSVTTRVFIYPNPNSGNFQVRYYSAQNNPVSRQVLLYDAKGARVYHKLFSTIRSYDRIDINASKMQSGIYLLELKDANGKRLATGKVVVL